MGCDDLTNLPSESDVARWRVARMLDSIVIKSFTNVYIVSCPTTQAYIARRTAAEAQTSREIRAASSGYITRQLYAPSPSPWRSPVTTLSGIEPVNARQCQYALERPANDRYRRRRVVGLVGQR